jgi:hypothetical protein
MKYVISENRMSNLINKFIVDQLGQYKSGVGSIIGKYYSNGELAAIIYFQNKKVFVDMDGKIYNLIKDMFDLSMPELDEILSSIFSERSGIRVSEIYPLTPFP